MELYDPEPPIRDDYPWGLEELFGAALGAAAVAVAGFVWLTRRFWSE